MNEKILLIGKGFLGRYIASEAQNKGLDVVSTHHTYQQEDTISMDISNFEQVNRIISELKPDFVINCAVIGDVDFLQEHRDIAMKTNAEGPKNIAIACKKNNARLIHISTDAVFDGKNGNYREDDLPNPVNVYGESKLQGEQEIIKNTNNYIICRTNFFGIDNRGKYFFSWILKSIKEKKTINGFTDVMFSPIDVNTLSKIIIELLPSKYVGVLHLSGQPISKYDFIKKVVEFVKYDISKVMPVSIDNHPLKAPRPKDTSLSSNISKSIIKTHIPTIDEWLKNNKSEIMQLIK